MLFYYQSHIGNLPAFISQTNFLWIALSVSLTVTLFYGFMLILGAMSAFWFYACLVIFFQQWRKVSTLSGTGAFPWTRLRQITVSVCRYPIVVIGESLPLLKGCFLIIVVACLSALAANCLLTWLQNSSPQQVSMLHDVILAPFHSMGSQRATLLPPASQTDQPSHAFFKFFALLVTNLISSIVSTSIWQKYRLQRLPDQPSTIRNCPPVSDRAWFFYIAIALIVSLILTLTALILLSDKPEEFFWPVLTCNVISALLPIILWRGCHSLPQTPTPAIHNVFPRDKFSFTLYIIISLFSSLMIFLLAALNITEIGLISLILYFCLSGFLLLTFVDNVPADKLRQNPAISVVLLVFFLIFHGSWSAFSRECMAFAGFHTWRQNAVFVTPEIANNVSALLEAYGGKPNTCTTTISGREMVRLSVTVNKTFLPLQVLWNDGSDKRLLGFDTERIPQRNFGPEIFIPPVSTNNSNVLEMTEEYLSPCTPQ
ncbi:putative membrane protein [Gluconacetobacter diazotrophicus PA1 5]|uniref:Putative membrane protein n=2 Tax=Gluconacetobacter diazotrophicus TaxID=33996 RepID=A9HCM6_GLUDA|nr:putative membrane protein [Gluconacetobacter diazotrophicus PA1 5]